MYQKLGLPFLPSDLMPTLDTESLSTAYWSHRAWVWFLLLLGGWLFGVGLAELLHSIDTNGWGSGSVRWTWKPIGSGLSLFGLGIYRDTRRLPAGTTLTEVRAEQQMAREKRHRSRDSLMRRKQASQLEAVAPGPSIPRLRIVAWILLFLTPSLMHLIGEALFPRSSTTQPSPASIFVLLTAALVAVIYAMGLDLRSRGEETLWGRLVKRVQL